jgi:hypothetical protein
MAVGKNSLIGRIDSGRVPAFGGVVGWEKNRNWHINVAVHRHKFPNGGTYDRLLWLIENREG